MGYKLKKRIELPDSFYVDQNDQTILEFGEECEKQGLSESQFDVLTERMLASIGDRYRKNGRMLELADVTELADELYGQIQQLGVRKDTAATIAEHAARSFSGRANINVQPQFRFLTV